MRLRSALAITGALSLLVASAAMVAGTERILLRMQEPHPYQLRHQLTVSTLDMIAERPALGFGMGTWRSAYLRFARFDDGFNRQ